MVDHIHSSLGKNVITQYQEKVRLTRNNEEARRGERDTIWGALMCPYRQFVV